MRPHALPCPPLMSWHNENEPASAWASLLAPARWRFAVLALEGPVEGFNRLVAHRVGDLRDALASLAQLFLGKPQAPLREVADWCYANERSEPVVEGAARKACLPGNRRSGPGRMWSAVQRRKGAPDIRISHPLEPSRVFI